jgi:hypothetical protein
MIDPIGCLETTPTPKFENLYNVFEHLFSLKRGFDAYVQTVWLLDVDYSAWLLWLMDSWRVYMFFIARICSINRYSWGDDLFRPSWGLWSPMMDAETPRLGKACDRQFHSEEKESFPLEALCHGPRERFPSSHTRTLAFGGLDATLWPTTSPKDRVWLMDDVGEA